MRERESEREMERKREKGMDGERDMEGRGDRERQIGRLKYELEGGKWTSEK